MNLNNNRGRKLYGSKSGDFAQREVPRNLPLLIQFAVGTHLRKTEHYENSRHSRLQKWKEKS
jgi:hypothetical protein